MFREIILLWLVFPQECKQGRNAAFWCVDIQQYDASPCELLFHYISITVNIKMSLGTIRRYLVTNKSMHHQVPIRSPLSDAIEASKNANIVNKSIKST